MFRKLVDVRKSNRKTNSGNMKAKLILINWVLSFMGVVVVSPFWASMVGAAWFVGSCLLLAWAQKQVWFDKGIKKNKALSYLLEE